MTEFRAFAKNVEVKGEIVCSFVDAMGAFQALAEGMLREHGIESPNPAAWYRQQAWLDSLRDIAEKIGPNTLFQIARQIPVGAPIPLEFDSLEKAFGGLDEAYRGTHRGGHVGHYRVIESHKKYLKLECSTPYPCDFERGVAAGLAHRYESDNPLLDVHHDVQAPCKKKGDDLCIYTVSW